MKTVDLKLEQFIKEKASRQLVCCVQKDRKNSKKRKSSSDDSDEHSFSSIMGKKLEESDLSSNRDSFESNNQNSRQEIEKMNTKLS